MGLTAVTSLDVAGCKLMHVATPLRFREGRRSHIWGMDMVLMFHVRMLLKLASFPRRARLLGLRTLLRRLGMCLLLAFTATLIL
jgi:hypothetical protein